MKTWSEFLLHEQQQPYYLELQNFITAERAAGKVIFPKEADVFQAFALTPLKDVKVVILGQDPYHGPEQAHGLCFSVLPGIKIPPSLRNMYKELSTDIDGFAAPDHGYLIEWAQQGVLMLNTVLTVEQAKAHSHAKSGWETFTDHVVELLNQQDEEIIFVLWGNHAKKKGCHIDRSQHHVLEGVHPSPLSASRGFFGSQHFSAINSRLQLRQQTAINWQVSTVERLI
ncbi:uracil-DNA glycosylase [Moritella yayanosii]|uniref:Uracil-DNA glycosylase n=1 Tax=Moritella yayanosii TaxID=69539 RepID=A0A330LQS7_9GAMM|nr:uracil-DNA glycosylase [Moritella yayanosii]SQD78792.1 uracil-DNA-glycosylase [Moritella yayanosii]